jgi:hypothetical protein
LGEGHSRVPFFYSFEKGRNKELKGIWDNPIFLVVRRRNCEDMKQSPFSLFCGNGKEM